MKSIQVTKIRTSLRADPTLFEEFQHTVREVFGKLKGAQELALNDAIRLWLELTKGAGGTASILFGYVEVDDFKGYRTLSVEEFVDLSDRVKGASVFAVNGSIHWTVIEKLLQMKPDRTVLIDEDGQVREFSEKQSSTDLYNSLSKSTLCMVWDEAKMVVEVDERAVRIVKSPVYYDTLRGMMSRKLGTTFGRTAQPFGSE